MVGRIGVVSTRANLRKPHTPRDLLEHGQCVLPDRVPHVIEILALRPAACLDIPQTLAVRELRDGQAEKLLDAREAFELVLDTV